MKTLTVSFFSILVILYTQENARAQLTAAKDGRIVYGHYHLYVTSVAEHKKFWVDTLGGAPVPFNTQAFEAVSLPNVFVLLSQRDAINRPVRPVPSGDTRATPVNHIGFQVPNLRAMVNKVKASGYPIVTRTELPTKYEVKDGLGFIPDQNTYVAFVMTPDDVKVEFVENKSMTGSIALHHIHFAAPNVDEMQAWYVKTFNAKPGRRGSFKAADLPGVNLTFSPASGQVVTTRGRTVDHIGFEVKDLEGFLKQLEASGVKLDRGYTKAGAMGLATAMFVDPWGTFIEPTEGLATSR